MARHYFPALEDVSSKNKRDKKWDAKREAERIKRFIADASRYLFIELLTAVIIYLLKHKIDIIYTVLALVMVAFIIWKLGMPSV